MTPELLAQFDNACAYCKAPPEVEDHLVPRNRTSGGLHSWGNVVPSCRRCNGLKRGRLWEQHLASLGLSPEHADAARERISDYVTRYRYAPDMRMILPVLAGLYTLADQQTRGLVKFALAATEPHLASMAGPD